MCICATSILHIANLSVFCFAGAESYTQTPAFTTWTHNTLFKVSKPTLAELYLGMVQKLTGLSAVRREGGQKLLAALTQCSRQTH